MSAFEFFQYGFLQRALLAGSIVAVVAPLIGIFLVTRRYSFMADTLSHVSLAGVALGALLGWHPILTALLASVAAAVTVDLLRSRGAVVGETALAIFLSGGLAVSSVLLGLGKGGALNLHAVLFGSITTVTADDVWLIAILGALSVAAVVLCYPGLFAIAQDEELAIAGGLPVRALNLLLVTLAAVTVSVTMRVVGVLLVGALMVIPVAAVLQLKRGFFVTLLLGIAIAVVSVWLGLYLSFVLSLPSGGVIVLCALAGFLGCAVMKK